MAEPMDIDSDFYGDEETVSALQARVDSFDTGEWRQSQEACNIPSPQVKTEPSEGRLYNPYAGVHYAWQLTETVEAFLKRLPPATTNVAHGLDWIYVCNPYIPRQEKALSESQQVRGCEDEGPLDFDSRLDTFMEGGGERLNLFRAFIERSYTSGRTQLAVSREVGAARNEAVMDILALAHMQHIRSGKWMLFPEPGDVNEVWEVVVRATINNQLGSAAKVAPRMQETPNKARLICIYTSDFMDKDDIGRVLCKLKDLGLVRVNGRPIYYKCDAYTYLGISSGNVWDIKPSLYSSTEIFGYCRASGKYYR